MYIIRKANDHDILQISALIKQLGYEQDGAQFAENYQNCLKSGVYNCLVTVKEAKIIAMAAFIIYPLVYKNFNHCSLEAIVVDIEHRNQGIGARMIEKVENCAREKNCSSISLISNINRDQKVREFYLHQGYSNEGHAAQIYLKKRL